MNCANPIDAAVLADYWLSLLTEDDEEAVELHLFDCDECGKRLRQVKSLADGIRKLAREGSLRMVVSDAFLRRLNDEGLRIRQYDIPAGAGVQCTVKAEDDFLIARLAGDLTGVKRIDLSLCDERGVEQRRLADIPIPQGANDVIYQESITFAKSMPSSRMIARLVTFDEAGGEHEIGRYTFDHTRSL